VPLYVAAQVAGAAAGVIGANLAFELPAISISETARTTLPMTRSSLTRGGRELIAQIEAVGRNGASIGSANHLGATASQAARMRGGDAFEGLGANLVGSATTNSASEGRSHRN